MTAPHRESQPGTARANWTPEQFWEYADGLLGTHVRDQMRDMLADRGLAISPAGSGVLTEIDASGLGTVCFDDGRTYTPTDHEKEMLEDAINGYTECEQRQAEAATPVSSADSRGDK